MLYIRYPVSLTIFFNSGVLKTNNARGYIYCVNINVNTWLVLPPFTLSWSVLELIANSVDGNFTEGVVKLWNRTSWASCSHFRCPLASRRRSVVPGRVPPLTSNRRQRTCQQAGRKHLGRRHHAQMSACHREWTIEMLGTQRLTLIGKDSRHFLHLKLHWDSELIH